MATEESPLLVTRPLPTNDIHNRFTHGQKRVILAIASLSGLIPMFVGGSFVPSIPQISKDLNATPTAVTLGVSLSVLASSLGVLFWSAYSSFYGRRLMYICGMPFAIFGSFAVAASTDIYSLLFWRFVQEFGYCGGFALGAATIGDIYKVEERGTAMGTYFGATLLGLALAPPLGGTLAEYWSWRGFQAVLGVCGVVLLLLFIFFLPETTHLDMRDVNKVERPGKLFVWINPFRCLVLLRSPNIVAVTLSNTFAVMSDYALMIPIAYTIGAKYGITSETLLGILFLPNGVGNLIGAPISGYISDMVVRQAKEKRKGVWVPEDRLRAVWLGGLVLIPISVTLAGFMIAYVNGMVGLVISLMCLFFNGLGVDMVLTPIGAYTVDILPSKSAEAMAATSAFRALLLTLASALLLPSIEIIGVAATNSISGVLALFGYALIWLTIRYGKQMRAYVDVGYPDFDAQASLNDSWD